jgi:hypothetical protein
MQNLKKIVFFYTFFFVEREACFRHDKGDDIISTKQENSTLAQANQLTLLLTTPRPENFVRFSVLLNGGHP